MVTIEVWGAGGAGGSGGNSGGGGGGGAYAKSTGIPLLSSGNLIISYSIFSFHLLII